MRAFLGQTSLDCHGAIDITPMRDDGTGSRPNKHLERKGSALGFGGSPHLLTRNLSSHAPVAGPEGTLAAHQRQRLAAHTLVAADASTHDHAPQSASPPPAAGTILVRAPSRALMPAFETLLAEPLPGATAADFELRKLQTQVASPTTSSPPKGLTSGEPIAPVVHL